MWQGNYRGLEMKLTEVARKTIEADLDYKKFELDDKTRKEFRKKGASFVTLTTNGELRGCIGSLTARQELWKDVQENAINAAFRDPRFLPVRQGELKDIKIEVSVLSKPKKLKYKSQEELLGKITKEMGLILSFNDLQATYLPQVWEQISDKREFLESLAVKAGLHKDDWKNAEFEYYAVKKEEE